MGAEFKDFAVLLGEEFVKGEQARDALQKKSKLLLDFFRVLNDLAIRPAEDAPSLVNQAVLPEQVVLVLLDRYRIGRVPGEAVDLEGNLLVGRPDRVIDKPATPVNILDGVLVGEHQHLLGPEHL